MDESLASKLASLRTARQGPGVPRLHKPAMVALLLHRYIADGWVAASHDDITDDLKRLLTAVGVEGQIRTEYPFWRLRTDGFWTVDGADELEAAMNDAGDVVTADLTAAHIGRWTQDALADFRADGARRHLNTVLGTYFDAAQRAALLAALPSRRDFAQSPITNNGRED
ncbi:hypothetical protein [uncultured Williamsia sp.]|uniref:hypothetical protein n=1 Tax=uncultured Williamsia sp. TaxID=259311 RepID=UPI0026201FB8|nr:hypothetical protein [uncultured Williamsia sp.]